MVVPHENSVVVSNLWLKGLSRAEEIWIGKDFVDCAPVRGAEVISITASSSGPEMKCMIRNEKNLFYLFTTFNHK